MMAHAYNLWRYKQENHLVKDQFGLHSSRLAILKHTNLRACLDSWSCMKKLIFICLGALSLFSNLYIQQDTPS